MQPMALIIAVIMILTALVPPAYAARYGSGWYGEILAVYERDDYITRTYNATRSTITQPFLTLVVDIPASSAIIFS